MNWILELLLEAFTTFQRRNDQDRSIVGESDLDRQARIGLITVVSISLALLLLGMGAYWLWWR
jgi:hypothetical protein